MYKKCIEGVSKVYRKCIEGVSKVYRCIVHVLETGIRTRDGLMRWWFVGIYDGKVNVEMVVLCMKVIIRRNESHKVQI